MYQQSYLFTRFIVTINVILFSILKSRIGQSIVAWPAIGMNEIAQTFLVYDGFYKVL